MCSAYHGDHIGQYLANQNSLLILKVCLSIISKHTFQVFFQLF